MSHALSVTSPRTLAVLLPSLLVCTSLACNKDEPKKAEPTASTAGPAPVAGTDAPPVDPTAPPVTSPAGAVTTGSGGQISVLSAEPEVLGHFAIANGSRLLADIKTQLLPPKYAGFLEEAALRSLVSMALDKRSNLALNYDLAAPLGCALVEPKLEDIKVGCTFGYKGGAQAFVTDLGDTNKQADAAGHVAAYGVEGKSVYVDALGDAVVVTSGADTFGKTQAYLQRNILDRAGSIHGDLEIVGYVSTIVDRYRAELAPIFEEMSGSTPAPTGNPAVDGAVKAWTDYRQKSSKTTMDRVAEYSQFTMYFSVEPAGVTMGGALFPKAGSRAAQEMAVYGETRVDPSFAGLAPSGTVMMYATHMSQKAWELPTAVEGRKLIADAWGSLSGREPALIEAAVTAFARENAALYDGQHLLALGREPNALFGLAVASRLQAGKSARDSWKTWSAAFTPEAVLGAEFSKYATWSFKTDAATIEGVAVDRWTIEPNPEMKKKMQADMDAEGKAFVDKALGGLVLNIDRAEVGNAVVFVIAPKAESAYMKRAISALQGKDNVAAQPGLGKALARDPQTAGLLAVDVKQGMAWLRDLTQFGAKTENVPQNIGTDLGDFYLTLRYTGDGATAMEYVFSQQLIDQLKPLIPQ